MSSRVSTGKTAINIASQWCQHITAVAVNFFLISYVVGKLGPDNYGGWTTIISIIGYLSILSAGMSVAIQHYVARYSTAEDQTRMISLFSSSYIFYGAGAITATLLSLGFSFVFPSVFAKVPEGAAQECCVALRCAGWRRPCFCS